MRRLWIGAIAVAGAVAVGCGQDPAFVDIEGGAESDAIGEGAPSDLDAQGAGVDGQSIDEFGDDQGGILGDVIGEGVEGGGQTDGNGSSNGGDVTFPDFDGDDLDALRACMEKWGEVPFSGQTNVRRISAAVTVGGVGVAVNDTERTDTPRLVLISAAVNVGGSPLYRLLNPNGYYCIKTAVNVFSNLTVDLHCNARLSDSQVGVSVGSVMNGDVAAIGVHVGSQISVNTIRPDGDTCLR